jgi:hypothetical protein
LWDLKCKKKEKTAPAGILLSFDYPELIVLDNLGKARIPGWH